MLQSHEHSDDVFTASFLKHQLNLLQLELLLNSQFNYRRRGEPSV